MSGGTGLLLLLVAAAASAAAGVPLFAVLAGAGVAAMVITGTDLAVAAVEVHRLASTPTLVALPLFVLAGVVLSQGRSPRRFKLLLRAAFSWLPGGEAVGIVLAATLFTAFSGASGLTLVALGGLFLHQRPSDPRLQKRRIGAITAAGTPGLLLPPSLPVIVYAITAGVPVDQLYRATLVPAVVLVTLLASYAALRSPTPRAPFRWRRLLVALRMNAWELPLPLLVTGGLFSGVVALSEVAVVMAGYTLLAALLRGELKLGWASRVLSEAATMSAVILAVVAAAFILSNVLVDQQVPQSIVAAIARDLGGPVAFLLLLNVTLLVAGMFFDIFSATVVLVPLVAPAAARLGIDPLHLGTIFLLNLEVGYLTPPVGINLFVAKLRFGQPIAQVYRAALPYLGIMLLVLAAVTYLPELAVR